MSFVIRPLSSFPSRSSLLVRPTSTRAFSVTPARALSKITLVGRLAGEPELSPTSTGQEIVKYTVATNYGPKDERKTSWWRISYFPREGNNAGRDHVLSLGKGSLVYVEGTAHAGRYEDKEGKSHNVINIRQMNIEVLQKRDPEAMGQDDDERSRAEET